MILDHRGNPITYPSSAYPELLPEFFDVIKKRSIESIANSFSQMQISRIVDSSGRPIESPPIKIGYTLSAKLPARFKST